MLVVNTWPVRYACGPSGRVTACVVYTADSIRRFDSNEKKRFAGPYFQHTLRLFHISSHALILSYSVIPFQLRSTAAWRWTDFSAIVDYFAACSWWDPTSVACSGQIWRNKLHCSLVLGAHCSRFECNLLIRERHSDHPPTDKLKFNGSHHAENVLLNTAIWWPTWPLGSSPAVPHAFSREPGPVKLHARTRRRAVGKFRTQTWWWV